MPKTSVPRPNGHVWTAAAQFYDAAEALIVSDAARYPLPVVMSYAFAAELAIKSAEVVTKYGAPSIYTADPNSSPGTIIGAATLKSTATGHDLAAVFAKLAPDAQSAIIDEFRTETGEELKPLLDRCGTYFVDARYLFENPSGAFDLGSAELLARGLLNAVMAYGGGTVRVGRAE